MLLRPHLKNAHSLLNAIFQSSLWRFPQYWLLFSRRWQWQILHLPFCLLKIFLNISQVLRLIHCQEADLAWAGTWQLLIRLETTGPNNSAALSLSFCCSLFDDDIEPVNGALPLAFMQHLRTSQPCTLLSFSQAQTKHEAHKFYTPWKSMFIHKYLVTLSDSAYQNASPVCTFFFLSLTRVVEGATWHCSFWFLCCRAKHCVFVTCQHTWALWGGLMWLLIATKENVCERHKVCVSGWISVCVRACAHISADTCSQPLICTCCLVVSRQVSHQPGELLLEEPSANFVNSCLCLCSRLSACWGACLHGSV